MAEVQPLLRMPCQMRYGDLYPFFMKSYDRETDDIEAKVTSTLHRTLCLLVDLPVFDWVMMLISKRAIELWRHFRYLATLIEVSRRFDCSMTVAFYGFSSLLLSITCYLQCLLFLVEKGFGYKLPNLVTLVSRKYLVVKRWKFILCP